MSVCRAMEITQPALRIEFADAVSAVDEKDIALGIDYNARCRVSPTGEPGCDEYGQPGKECGYARNDCRLLHC